MKIKNRSLAHLHPTPHTPRSATELISKLLCWVFNCTLEFSHIGQFSVGIKTIEIVEILHLLQEVF